MRSIKSLLTIPLCLAALAMPSYAADPSQHREVAQSETRELIGYSWPYAGQDLQAELGGAPLVLELFTAQGCPYCPVADHFFADLQERYPVIIGLSCHVTYRDVQQGSYGLFSCNDRQDAYAKSIPKIMPFTPQMIFNGRGFANGADYKAVLQGLKDAQAAPPAEILISPEDGDAFSVRLPEVDATAARGAVITVIQYLHPIDKVISTGDNVGIRNNYVRTVSSIADGPEWSAGMRAVTLEIIRDEGAEGAVVLLQSPTGILAAGTVKF